MEVIIKIFGGSLIGGLLITALIHLYKKHGFGLVNILKNSFGALFIFSAAVKAIDPLGTAYKMGEYFEELNLAFLHPLSLTFSVVMIVLELALALALIFAYKKQITLGLLFAMNIFFTFLTGYTTITGKVTDCGCFGDFLKLEPQQSFYKDIFLIFILIIIYFGRDKIKEVFTGSKSLFIVLAASFVFLIFNFSNFYFDIPMVDFRPYAIGNDINEQRIEIPDQLDYGFKFKNESTGETKRVEMGEYGKYNADPAWKFTGEQDNIVLKKGVEAKINNFGAFDRNGDDNTDDILSYEGYSIWILTKTISETDIDAWKNIKALETFTKANNHRIFAFSASVYAETDVFKKENNLSLDFYEADDIFIKTVVRANPGIVLLKNGKVQAKWHHRHIPSVDEIKALIK
ncbi:MAG: BT_3928 family protein [Chitinophagales bacterium]